MISILDLFKKSDAFNSMLAFLSLSFVNHQHSRRQCMDILSMSQTAPCFVKCMKNNISFQNIMNAHVCIFSDRYKHTLI